MTDKPVTHTMSGGASNRQGGTVLTTEGAEMYPSQKIEACHW